MERAGPEKERDAERVAERVVGTFPFRLAAFDLDGTLMRFDATISAATLDALEGLRALGVRVVLATGRRYESARDQAERLGFAPAEPLVCYGGSMVRTVGGETSYSLSMPPEGAGKVLRWAEKRGVRSRILLDGRIVASRDPTGVHNAASDLVREEVVSVESPAGWLEGSGEKPFKVTLVDRPDRVEGWLEEVRETFSSRFFVTRSLPHYVEVGDRNGTKSRALGFLCEKWDVRREEVIAFGDGENDVDMLRFAGRGVAVGPMSRAVREAADEVAPAVGEEGVARYLASLLEGSRLA